MGLAEEPLLYAIVRSHHDPDPVRAFRYRPFHVAPPMTRTTGPGAEARGPVARAVTRGVAAIAAVPGWLRLAAAQPTPLPQPCC